MSEPGRGQEPSYEQLRALLVMLVRDPAVRANLQDLAEHRPEWAWVSELLPDKKPT